MANLLKLVAVSALIDTDKQGLPLQRQTGIDKEGNPVYTPNPCRVFSFRSTGSEISVAKTADGQDIVRSAINIISFEKPYHRTVFQHDAEEVFNAKPGQYLVGRIYTNVPCETFKTQVRIRNAKDYATEERSFDTTSVVAFGREDILMAMKNSGRRPLEGYDYSSFMAPKATTGANAPAELGLKEDDAKAFAEASMQSQF